MANKSKAVKFRPAGKDDKFKIELIHEISIIIENGKYELKVIEANEIIEDLAPELAEGRVIKAHDGKPINFESRKSQIEARRKTTNIEEYKKSKQKDEGREIG